MECNNRKRRGFKGKLVMSFYRAPKSSPMQFSGKVKSTSSSTASVGFVVSEGLAVLPPKQNTTPPSLAKTDVGGDPWGGRGYVSDGCDGDGGGGIPIGEDSVDKRAADYISSVQQRFRQAQIEYRAKKGEAYID